MQPPSLSPWQTVRDALEACFSDAKPRLLVLDDYQAKYLERLLPGYEVEGLYSYLSRRVGFSIASALDIYESFQVALTKALGDTPAIPFWEGWDYAKNFSEDIREILLSFVPHRGDQEFLEPLLSVWRAVSEEKALEALFTFRLNEKDIPWLEVLQLPRAYTGPVIKTLYEKIPEVAKAFLYFLWEKRTKVLGEELFLSRPLEDKVIFWNIFVQERRIQKWIQHQVETGQAEWWGWDIRPLQDCIGAPLWSGNGAPSIPSYDRVFTPWEARAVYLKNSFRSQTELLEVVAEEIARAYREGHRVGVWVGEASVKPLLEKFLWAHGASDLTLMNPTLSQTQIGSFLHKAYQEGRIPAPNNLPGWGEGNSAEDMAYHLYYLFYKASEAKNLNALMQFLRFLDRVPAPLPWPAPPENFITGGLAQLAGLAYEKLYIVLPPNEPLGAWFRPSFLPAPIRRRYYPPTHRTYTAWRLLTILLYGARETHIYQIAGEENQSPLEDFLIHFPKQHPCLMKLWTIDSSCADAFTPPAVLGASSALSLPLPATIPCKPPEAISPSDLYDFLVCPRRYYLRKIASIPQGPAAQEAFLGNWLHQGLSRALIGMPRSSKTRRPPQALFLSEVSILERLWAPGRLYRILRSAYYWTLQESGLKLPALSQNPEMRFWHRLWAQSGRIFYEHVSKTCTDIAHLKNLRLHPEVWISKNLAPGHVPTLRGRMDLLITTEENIPLFALDYKTGALSDKLGKLADFYGAWEKALDWVTQGGNPPAQMVRSIDLQGFTYVMNFPASFSLITASAISGANFVIYRLSDCERGEVQDLWGKSFEIVNNRWLELCKVLSKGSEESRRQAVEALFPMTPNERSCVYCPYKLLCQRL